MMFDTDAYRELYHAYTQLNRVCWQGRLPPCVLVTSIRMRRAWGTAYARCPIGGYMIAMNLHDGSHIPDEYIFGILAHEMTHIWQFSNGRSGGHGRDFRQEMLRLGIDERNGHVAMDSPFAYCVKLRRLMMQDLNPVFHRLLTNHPCRQDEFRFFQQYQYQLFQ